MTCLPPHAHADAAAVPSPPTALARHLDSMAQPSGPAPITETQPMTGTASRIASRCKRLRHSNNVQRVRYLTLHRTLSNPSGDA